MNKFDDIKILPIYQKAILIAQLVDSLMGAISEEDEFLTETKHLMLEDAFIICSKIAGAEGGNLYSIRMQNAALIRHHALSLYTQVGGLKYHESFKNIEYVNLIRDEIDAFRLLFIDWVAGFDTSQYVWDEWELFNPKDAIPPDPTDDELIDWDDLDFEDEDDKDEVDE
jgi:hypothetical protein